MSIRSMRKTCEKMHFSLHRQPTFKMFKVPQRFAKEILSPGSLIQINIKGTILIQDCTLQQITENMINFFFYVPVSLKVESDLKLGTFYLSGPPSQHTVFALMFLFCGHKKAARHPALHLSSKQEEMTGQKAYASKDLERDLSEASIQ